MKKKIWYFFIVILISSCKYNINNSKTNSILTYKNLEFIVPEKIEEYIKNNLPDYKLPDTTEYYKGFCFFFNKTSKHYFKEQIPFFITTDINDDFKSDYALLLKDKNDILKLIIIYSTNNSYRHWIDDIYPIPIDHKIGIQHGICIEPPRKIDCVVNNEEKSLILKSNGISLYKLEEMIRVYYWENDSFKVFITR